MDNEIKNPFEYLTPDSIEAKSAIDIFVDVFKDYYNVLNQGNTFITGPRGSGKSMMFRIMKPDCQKLKNSKSLNELKFFGVYIPVKDTSLNVTDLKILEDKHGANLLNEHFMVLYLSIVIFNALKEQDYSSFPNTLEEIKNFYNHVFIKRLINSGWQKEESDQIELQNTNSVFEQMKIICETMQSKFVHNYVRDLTNKLKPIPYLGPLCLYFDFLFPILKEIRKFSFLPKAPIYLMVDDADELSLTQTKILNSWVSFRSTADVCYKISSTHLRYKTYYTTSNSRIDSPHDYSELDLTEVYTSDKKDRYYSNVKEMVEKRLKAALIKDISAEKYFPANEKQEAEIKKLSEKYKADHGYDYAYRYSRPDYMKGLPNKYAYSYSGFTQLVHLSSGIIRNFLDLAAKMFTRTINEGKEFLAIPDNIQDSEIKDYSDKFLHNEFDKLTNDENLTEEKLNNHKKLYNLIQSLGKMFRIILMSDAKERRIFSFQFEDEPSQTLKEVLKLGVIYNYFQISAKGDKAGTGRAKLYILNRMLAPYFRLDPNNFSGYKYLTSDSLELAMTDFRKFLFKFTKGDFSSDFDGLQMKLFDSEDIL